MSVDATGLQIPGVLDDLFATDRALGVGEVANGSGQEQSGQGDQALRSRLGQGREGCEATGASKTLPSSADRRSSLRARATLRPFCCAPYRRHYHDADPARYPAVESASPGARSACTFWAGFIDPMCRTRAGRPRCGGRDYRAASSVPRACDFAGDAARPVVFQSAITKRPRTGLVGHKVRRSQR